MARGGQTPEQREIAKSDAAARVMEKWAASAGLAWPPVSWLGQDQELGTLASGIRHSERSAQRGVEESGCKPRLHANAPSSSLAERFETSPFLMAPMAGVTDAAYRIMARAGGAALAYSEMVSVTGMHYGSDKTWELVDPNPAESELAVQLFGANVEHFREAVPQVAERLGGKLALIDVNMACPVPKVTKSGAGSALLDEPELAAAIVAAIREELAGCGRGELPVTIKMRLGRTPDRYVGPEFAARMEQAGVSAIAVHGRFASQMYRGESDDARIAEVRAAVGVPLIVSGDVLSPARANEVLVKTGADACFVARGSYGNPWIFRNALELRAGREAKPLTPQMRLAAFRLHVRLLEATGAHIARARSLAGWYLRGVPEAAAWRERAMHCNGVADYLALADEFEATLDGGSADLPFVGHPLGEPL